MPNQDNNNKDMLSDTKRNQIQANYNKNQQNQVTNIKAIELKRNLT